MQIGNNNKLAFGYGHVRIDTGKLKEEEIKQIKKILELDAHKQLPEEDYTFIDENKKTKKILIDFCRKSKEIETKLINKVKQIGAFAVQTFDFEETAQMYMENRQWLRKKPLNIKSYNTGLDLPGSIIRSGVKPRTVLINGLNDLNCMKESEIKLEDFDSKIFH